jgi:hypothetical protein
MGAGVVILANSRPYEGLIFSVPIAVAVLWWLAHTRGTELRQALSGVVLPLAAVLICGALATGYYYHRVTGDAFRMTYQVNRETYAMAPYFLWQSPQPEPGYHHAAMREFYQWELRDFEKNRSFASYFSVAWGKVRGLWQFYLGPLLTLPLLALPWVVRRPKMRLPLTICVAMAAGALVQTWTLPHYLSPAMCVLYLLIVQCLRQIWHWQPGGRAVGVALVRAIPVIAGAMILVRVAAAAVHVQIEPAWPRGNLSRAAIVRDLEQIPGQQLVLVRYGNGHDVDWEWVWNEADIDGSKTVWARDMGDIPNQEILTYFKDRGVWCIHADDAPSHLEPCAAPTP